MAWAGKGQLPSKVEAGIWGLTMCQPLLFANPTSFSHSFPHLPPSLAFESSVV